MAQRPLSDEEIERRADALRRHGNIRDAARELGLAYSTLDRNARVYDLCRRAFADGKHARATGQAAPAAAPASPRTRVDLPDDGDEGVVVAPIEPPSKHAQIDPESDAVVAFLRERGVDLDTWVPISARVSSCPQT